jgi:ring-1,2-phenylacetyl-CoA epoxidase subunit PaaC
MAITSIRVAETPLVRLALSRADDALVLGHRLSEWTGHAPMLEEELALANIALDLIGQARTLYDVAAAAEGAGHSEDDFAYLRDSRQFRNCLLVEQPNGDFAATIVRQVLYSAFADPWWRAMMGSAHADLAAIAAKSEKESAYHLRHASEWLIRLGDGTAESHRRAQAALDALWPFAAELFDPEDPMLVAEGTCIDPPTIRPAWLATIDAVLAEATLTRPAEGWGPRGGREGRHGEAFGHMVTELQYLQRSHPGATW